MKREDAEEFTQSLGQIVGGSWRQIDSPRTRGAECSRIQSTEEWVQQSLGGYIRMAVPERREAVSNLTADGDRLREVAEILGISHVTVARDVSELNSCDPQSQRGCAQSNT